MAIQFPSSPTKAIIVIPGMDPKPLRYFAVWADFESQTTATDSDVLYNLVGWNYSTNSVATSTDCTDIWFETSTAPHKLNFRVFSKDQTDQSRFNVADVPTASVNREQVFVTQDMSNIATFPESWQSGSGYTVTEYTAPAGTPPGWSKSFMTLSPSEKVIFLGGWDSGNSVGQAFDQKLFSMAMFTSNNPFTESFYRQLYNRRINPMDHPGCFFYSDFKTKYPVNEVNGRRAFYHSQSTGEVVVIPSDRLKEFPNRKLRAPTHIRQEVPPATPTVFFPNNLLTDTFTDTNGVTIDNHTPDINNTGSSWLKRGVTSYPQIQSNQLAFSGDGATAAAKIDTGVNITQNTLRITGNIIQNSGTSEMLSIYVGGSTEAASYYLPSNGMEFAFNSFSDILVAKTVINDTGNILSSINFDFGATGTSWYFDIQLFIDGIWEFRVWQDTGKAWEVDRPANPTLFGRVFQNEWLNNDSKNIYLDHWYASSNQWRVEDLYVYTNKAGSTHEGHLLPNQMLELYNLTGSITAIDDPDITPGNDNDDWLTVT